MRPDQVTTGSEPDACDVAVGNMLSKAPVLVKMDASEAGTLLFQTVTLNGMQYTCTHTHDLARIAGCNCNQIITTLIDVLAALSGHTQIYIYIYIYIYTDTSLSMSLF